MRLTVCEFRNTPDELNEDWEHLIQHLQSENSDLLLLPEMAFSPWLAETNQIDEAKWQHSVNQHDEWLARFAELPVGFILGSRPVLDEGRRYNEGFVWSSDNGYQSAHRKVNLPDEAGWWEASWYEKGPDQFQVMEAGGARIGFLICSELWFNEHAREYMKQNVDILVTPRATPSASVDKWITAGKTAAIVAGAFSLSSNFSPTSNSNIDWGGAGWIIEPGDGMVLGQTSVDKPFVTADIDLEVARQAKRSYPRNVQG